jgi:nucleoside diphosphate kinase
VLTIEIILKLQEIMLVKLTEPYIALINRSRTKRRQFLAVDGLDGEFAVFTARYKRDPAAPKLNEDASAGSVIESYFRIYKHIEAKMVARMMDIAKEMITHLKSMPDEFEAHHLIKIILKPRSSPKKVRNSFFISEMEAEGINIFNRKLANIRIEKIDRFYPPMAKNPELFHTASYYIKALELRNKFYKKYEFKNFVKLMSTARIIEMKKLYVNDILACICGLEEEHIQNFLSNIQLRKPVKAKAVEIDENGVETVLEDGAGQFKSGNEKGLDEESSTCSEEDASDSETKD